MSSIKPRIIPPAQSARDKTYAPRSSLTQTPDLPPPRGFFAGGAGAERAHMMKMLRVDMKALRVGMKAARLV